jgi:signal transduction histidine kinase/ActR/RegA family two-component response regulator
MLPALARLQARIADAPDAAQADALRAPLWAERARMLSAHVPNVTIAGVVFALTLLMLLQGQVDSLKLGVWFGLRGLMVLPRLLHARRHARTDPAAQRAWYRAMVALVAVDGLIWGAAWWWLVPIDRVDLTAITLTGILGVAALSAFTLQADLRVMAWHVLPMLLPNAVYSLSSHNAYGLFGAASLAIFTVLLLLETRRAHARLVELLRLRFMHERVLQEREQALALAQHHSEAKSRFLAAMSHELRTPLHGILGLARLLREEEASLPKQRRLDLMERSGEHLLTVINDVLDVSKIEAGHVHIACQPFDLSRLVDEVVGVSSVTALSKGLSLLGEAELPPEHTVLGDAMRVRQILHNLLGNAIKFTEQGHVTLRVQRGVEGDGELVRFVVQDTGIGIAPTEQQHIFEAFHQVDHAPERRHGGTGLGLTISRELSQAMGGDLRCSSQLGQGSTFECVLRLPPHATKQAQAPTSAQAEGPASPAAFGAAPAAAGDAPQASAQADLRALDADNSFIAPPAQQASLGTAASLPATTLDDAPAPYTCRAAGQVLLVDDNPVNAMVAEAALRQLGVQVHIVDDGRKAVDWLAGNRADLVLMDCQMPVMDGVEAARQIREQEGRMAASPVPIIALTANNFPNERERCLKAGMNDYLGKPFRREELHQITRKYLAFASGPATLSP